MKPAPFPDDLPDADAPRRNSIKDYLILIGVGTVALVALIFALDSGPGTVRNVGPPHWSDRYVRAAGHVSWVLTLALLGYVMWRESSGK